MLPFVEYNLTVVDGKGVGLVSLSQQRLVACPSPDLVPEDVETYLLSDALCFYYHAGWNGTRYNPDSETLEVQPYWFEDVDTGVFWFVTAIAGAGTNAVFELHVTQEHRDTGFLKFRKLIMWSLVGVGVLALAITLFAVLAVLDCPLPCGSASAPPSTTLESRNLSARDSPRL
jgi:hypothetical protein